MSSDPLVQCFEGGSQDLPRPKLAGEQLNEARDCLREAIYLAMDMLEQDGETFPNPQAAEEARRLIRCDVIPNMELALGGTLDAE